jgi:hypothetical protein
MKAELEGKRYVATRARKKRNVFAERVARTKMRGKPRAAIILFRGPPDGLISCHKKVYDHAPEGARTSGVAFRGGRIATPSRQRQGPV